MPEYRAPGVSIQHILTEPARVLRTGVPVFLGLISRVAVDAWNDEHDNPDDADERFLYKPLRGDSGPSIVRKRGYVKLPSRVVDRATELQIGDPASKNQSTYMLSMPQRAHSESHRAKERGSLGAAGPTLASQASDDDLLKLVSKKPQRFTVWPQFEQTYRGLESAGFLSHAVRGFFENGGILCYVQLMSYLGADETQDVPHAIATALEAGLATLAPYDDYDLVCVPDLMWEACIREDLDQVTKLQDTVMAHCTQLGERMAILDSVPGGEPSTADVKAQRDLLAGEEGALYYPWVRVLQRSGTDWRVCATLRPRSRRLRTDRHACRRTQGAGQRGTGRRSGSIRPSRR